MKESEEKQDRPAATLDDLVALVERAAKTITRLQADIALCNRRIAELEQSEAMSFKEAEQWRELMKLVHQHGSITINLNKADDDAAKSDPPAS